MRRTAGQIGRRLALVGTIGALLGLLIAAPAEADCGGVQKARAHKRTRGAPPLAIGDSVMLLAIPNLSREGFQVDAHGCRGWNEGLNVIRQRLAEHKLPHLVVMALGADFSISEGGIREALHLLGPSRILGLVTPWELGGSEGSDARHVRDAGGRYRRHVRVLDWVAGSRGHRGWFQPDGVHLTFTGARAFARLFKRLLPVAAPPRRRRHRQPHRHPPSSQGPGGYHDPLG
jgi:hypothetical protein